MQRRMEMGHLSRRLLSQATLRSTGSQHLMHDRSISVVRNLPEHTVIHAPAQGRVLIVYYLCEIG